MPIARATCMKDEGPFHMEWLAYHAAVVVDAFFVATNSCTDAFTKRRDRVLTHETRAAWTKGKGPA